MRFRSNGLELWIFSGNLLYLFSAINVIRGRYLGLLPGYIKLLKFVDFGFYTLLPSAQLLLLSGYDRVRNSNAGCNLTSVSCGTQCRCTVIYFLPSAYGLCLWNYFSWRVSRYFCLSSEAFHIPKASCSLFSFNSHKTKTGYELSHKLFCFFFN
jgi:hypothetical protein